MAVIPPITPINLPQPAAPITSATGTPAPGFSDALANGIQQVSDLENQADAMIQDLATGGPTKIHEVMIANTKSSLAVDMLVQVRDRGLEAYQEIMRMQL
jgi:flagellar hook-basal body complex protein FliE